MLETPTSIEGPLAAIGLLWVVVLVIAGVVLCPGVARAAGNGTMSLTFADSSNAALSGACAELYTKDYANFVTSFCTTSTFPVTRSLAAGDYVELYMYQDSSGSVNTATNSPKLSVDEVR